MTTIGERIRASRELAGMLQSELAERVGVRSAGVISNWERDINRPNADQMITLCAVLGIKLSYLLDYYGKDEIADITPQGQKVGRAYDKATMPVKRTVEVALEPYMEEFSDELTPELPDVEIETADMKVYDEASAAGFGNYLSDDESYEMIPFPASTIPARADFGIRISGRSMEPTIADGSIAWVEAMPAVTNGDIGIFILNGDAYCKELFVEIERGRRRVLLLSHNEDYDDIEINEGDELRTVGKVIF